MPKKESKDGKANKAYKFRIYPNKEQEILIQKTFSTSHGSTELTTNLLKRIISARFRRAAGQISSRRSELPSARCSEYLTI